MKKIVGRTKGAMALALVVSLFGSTAYGAEAVAKEATTKEATTKEATTKEEAVQTQGEDAVPVLTFEDALEKAKKKSVDLANLQRTNELLQETKEDIWDAVGGFSLPTYEYQKWVDAGVYAYTSGVYQTDSGMKKNKYAMQMTNLALEATIKSTFASIVENEENLNLVKETSAIQKTTYEQGQAKLNLGMISQFSLDQLKAEYDKSKITVYQLEQSIAQMYTSLNNLLGEPIDKKYRVVYDVEFEPYVLQGSLEAYINASVKNDFNILLKEQAVEDAKFNQNYVSESTTNSTNKNNKFNYDSAKRDLKDAKENKDIAIRNAYVQLQQSEASYNQAVADLKLAQSKLKTAEVNYQVGNVTKLVLEQAQLGVTQKELALKVLARGYDMQVFMFKNPSLISGGTSAGGAGSASAKGASAGGAEE